MSSNTKIQWTDATWNIARGCNKVDEDCKFCYMYRQSLNKTRYDPAQVIKTKSVFDLPKKLNMSHSNVWPGRPLIFTSSLTDFFHQDIDSYRHEAWSIIRDHPQYIFQILTKRPERIAECLPADWGEGYENVWFGVSVGSNTSSHRLAEIIALTAKAFVKLKKIFVSLEPLHGALSPNSLSVLQYFDWVIVGGESGNDTGKYRYRPCDLQWILDIVSTCKTAGVPVFVKQLGTYLAKELQLTDRHGGNMDEWPEEIQVREFPTRIM